MQYVGIVLPFISIFVNAEARAGLLAAWLAKRVTRFKDTALSQ